MIPDQEDRHEPELSTESATAIRKVAYALGVIAGVLFFTAFAIGLVRNGEMNLWLLGLGLLFVAFPLIVNRVVRPGQ